MRVTRSRFFALCAALACALLSSCSEEECATCPSSEPSFSFGQSSYSVPESASTVAISISRNSTRDSAWVWLETTGGTATPELDFEPLARQVEFAPNDRMQVIALGVMNDNVLEAQETVGLILTQPSPGYTIANPESATVYILDSGGPPRFWFDDSGMGVVERSVRIEFTVRRSVIGDSAFVTVATMDETAIAGQDYYGLESRLEFGPQDSIDTVSIRIRNDSETENQETFRVLLCNPSDGYLVPDSSLVVVLHDDELRAPTNPIHFPMEVGDRWIYDAWGISWSDGSGIDYFWTPEIWVHSEIAINDHTLKVFRSTPRDTVAAVYLAQEGQDLLFVKPTTLRDPRVAPTLPWRVASFLEGPGIVDTLFRADEVDTDPEVIWKVENMGRSAVQVPAGIFLDVHVLRISFRHDWRKPFGWYAYYEDGCYLYYIADSVGIVRQVEDYSSYFGSGTSASYHREASLQSSSVLPGNF